MKEIIFVTGGQRSGKSSYAQSMVESLTDKPLYLATAKIWDEDFRSRVKRHQNDRGEQWSTIEEEIEISKHDLSGRTVMLDCITLWLTNIFYAHNYQVDESLEVAKKEWDKFVDQDFCCYVVSNELGMGVIPENEVARKFADLQGWMNQYIAKQADKVTLMVSGIPVEVKR